MANNLTEKLNQLVTDVKSQHIEVSDSTNAFQCMDFAYLWVFVLGFPKATIQHLYAYEAYTQPTTLTTQYFDIIANTPDGIPQAGDLVVFSNAVGKAGHICVASGIGDTKSFKSWDQNWNGNNSVVLTAHTYTSVLGWLRPKVKENTVDIDQATYKALVDAFNGLPTNDGLKNGNLEGYVRAITVEHLTARENEEKGKILDGLESKWKRQYALQTDATLTDIETEMQKGLVAEQELVQATDEIEKVVGHFDDPEARYTALQAVKEEIDALQKKVEKYQTEKVSLPLSSFKIGTYLVKIYKGV